MLTSYSPPLNIFSRCGRSVSEQRNGTVNLISMKDLPCGFDEKLAVICFRAEVIAVEAVLEAMSGEVAHVVLAEAAAE